MDGQDIEFHNESMPWFPEGMTLYQKVKCLLGYHKWERRNAAKDHKGWVDGKPIDLGNMRLRDQCGLCGTLR